MFHQKKTAKELRPDKAERPEWWMLQSKVAGEQDEGVSGQRAQENTVVLWFLPQEIDPTLKG